MAIPKKEEGFIGRPAYHLPLPVPLSLKFTVAHDVIIIYYTVSHG